MLVGLSVVLVVGAVIEAASSFEATLVFGGLLGLLGAASLLVLARSLTCFLSIDDDGACTIRNPFRTYRQLRNLRVVPNGAKKAMSGFYVQRVVADGLTRPVTLYAVPDEATLRLMTGSQGL